MKIQDSQHIEVKYKNWRGEIAIREIKPISVSYYKEGTEHHLHSGWFLGCFDVEKQAERTYALADCDFRMRGTLQDAWEAVREFHKAFGHPAPDVPTAQDWELAERRAMWIESECDELRIASSDGSSTGEPNITEQADAYLDIIYFALGGLVELGIEPSAIFDIVQAANMAKLGPDGKPMLHPDGKVKKPEGWESPDPKIKAHIEGLMNK